MSRILICDDEEDIVRAVAIYLSGEGYETVTAANGREALKRLAEHDIQLVLLDMMMPEMDGITVLHRIRETSNVPVIFLTAKAEDVDMILGLTVGADDYITKPFKPAELLARVKSALRRYLSLGGSAAASTDPVLQNGGICLYDAAKRVTVDGEEVALTPKEFDILKFFLQHRGQMFTPAQIYDKVWRDYVAGAQKTVAVHIRHLREKIEIDPANPRYLIAVWGQGYKMEEVGREG